MNQIEFLKETVHHYNSNNRSYDEERQMCTYFPAHNKTEGCAIGRHLDKELQLKLDARPDVKGVNISEVFNSLPEKLQSLNQHFLGYIQGLHDGEKYWSDNGLSKLGRAHAKYICRIFDLNFDQLDLN